MPFARKIVLHCLLGYDPRLDALGEELIRDGVHFVGVVGRDCERVEDIIAEIVVGHGSRDRCLLASSHPGEFLQAAIDVHEFVEEWLPAMASDAVSLGRDETDQRALPSGKQRWR